MYNTGGQATCSLEQCPVFKFNSQNRLKSHQHLKVPQEWIILFLLPAKCSIQSVAVPQIYLNMKAISQRVGRCAEMFLTMLTVWFSKSAKTAVVSSDAVHLCPPTQSFDKYSVCRLNRQQRPSIITSIFCLYKGL